VATRQNAEYFDENEKTADCRRNEDVLSEHKVKPVEKKLAQYK
jgi:hypothetical protein